MATGHGSLPVCTARDLAGFEEHCRVDRALAHRTVLIHHCLARKFLESCGWLPSERAFRSFLSNIENPSTRNNYIKSVRAFTSYMGGDITGPFRFAPTPPPPRRLLTKAELARFCSSIGALDEEAMFLLYASSGLRRLEVLSLKVPDVDLTTNTIYAHHQSRTKNARFSFFNAEAKKRLEEHLAARRDPKHSNKLFPHGSTNYSGLWRNARVATGLQITPQDLRFWFSNEMARLGVPDRYVNAFQGRVPGSIIARNYSDFSPGNLKKIYDAANLRIFD